MPGLTLHLFVVTIVYEYIQTKRDEFGWVDGWAPSDKNWKEATDTVRIQAPDKCYITAWVEREFGGECRNPQIKSIKEETIKIDAIITVS